MSTLDERSVVLARQHPVDLLGKPRGNGGGEGASGFEHTVQLGKCGDVVLNVFEYLGGDDHIEGPIAKRQSGGISAEDARETISGDLTCSEHCGERCSCGGGFRFGIVEGHHSRTASSSFVGVSTKACAGIQKQGAFANR